MFAGQQLLEAGFFHHVVDDHHFEDKPFFYRFYLDEDRKYKRFWRPGPSGKPSRRWRFQPHTVFNCPAMTVTLADALHDAVARSDKTLFTAS